MNENVKMVFVGGQRIGIVGLLEVFEEVKVQEIKVDEHLKKELLSRVKKKNYIPQASENEYVIALVDEYKKFLGMAVEHKKHMEIKILGPGCARCDQLEREVMNVLAELGLPADLEHVRDITRLKEYNVFGTPALIINGQVKSVGKVPSKNEIKQWINGIG